MYPGICQSKHSRDRPSISVENGTTLAAVTRTVGIVAFEEATSVEVHHTAGVRDGTTRHLLVTPSAIVNETTINENTTTPGLDNEIRC